MVRLKYESRAVLAVFLILPLAYYVLEYAFTVYTDLLYTGGAVILEFVDSFIVLLYVVFSLLTVEILRQKGKAERKTLCFPLRRRKRKRNWQESIPPKSRLPYIAMI